MNENKTNINCLACNMPTHYIKKIKIYIKGVNYGV